MSSFLFKNATIVDGSGKASYKASVLVDDGRIIRVDRSCRTATAEQVFDAEGYVLAPGFIDVHRHCDIKPFLDPSFGDAMLRQGITTTIVGNCGISMTPANPDPGIRRQADDYDEPVMGPAFEGISSFPGYVDALSAMDLPVNMGALIGTGNLRIAVNGFSPEALDDTGLARAHKIMEEAVRKGLHGFSSGLMYLPECHASEDDFKKLLSPIAGSDLVWATHIRGEGDSLVQSIREVVDIAECLDLNLEISHFKSCGMVNWRKEIFKAIAIIEEARAAGVRVSCDFYPYDGGSTTLLSMFPPAFAGGGPDAVVKACQDPEGVAALRDALERTYDGWDNYAKSLGWDRVIISSVTDEEDRKFIGLDMVDACVKNGFADPVELAAYLVAKTHGRASIITLSMCQDDIDTVARLPYSIVISDSIYAPTDHPHPRMYGAFPKIIRSYVNERGILGLEEAVHKMTGLPAVKYGIEGRGLVEEGMCADLNLFKPGLFRDWATYTDPAAFASGLEMCMIAGKVAVRSDAIVCRDGGRLLLRS